MTHGETPDFEDRPGSKHNANGPLNGDDAAILGILAGATFEGDVTLPSGVVLSGEEATVLSGLSSGSSEEARGRPHHRHRQRRIGKKVLDRSSDTFDYELEDDERTFANQELAIEIFKLHAGDGGTLEEKKALYTNFITNAIRNNIYPTHYYDYPFQNAARSFFVPRPGTSTVLPDNLCGSLAIHVLQPHSITGSTGTVLAPKEEMGHSSFFNIDEPRGSYWIPVYEDILDDLLEKNDLPQEALTKLLVEEVNKAIKTAIFFASDDDQYNNLHKSIHENIEYSVKKLITYIKDRGIRFEMSETEALEYIQLLNREHLRNSRDTAQPKSVFGAIMRIARNWINYTGAAEMPHESNENSPGLSGLNIEKPRALTSEYAEGTTVDSAVVLETIIEQASSHNYSTELLKAIKQIIGYLTTRG